jgi:hypothetical protein
MLSQANAQDLNVAVIGAVVGGLVAYVGGWMQDVLYRSRRRRSLATALLIELGWLDGHLDEIEAARSPSGRVRPIALRFHDAFIGEIPLFRSATVAAVLQCFGYANELTSRIDRLQSGSVEPGPTWDHELKRLASILKHELRNTREHLQKEGGRPPTQDAGTQGEKAS